MLLILTNDLRPRDFLLLSYLRFRRVEQGSVNNVCLIDYWHIWMDECDQ